MPTHVFRTYQAHESGLAVSCLATECLFPDAPLSCTASHDLALGSIHQRPTFLSLSALVITDTELRLIAALAIIGLSSKPNAG